MRYQRVLSGLFLGMISAVSAGCNASSPTDSPERAAPEERPVLPAQPKPKPQIRTFGGFAGKVTQVGPDWFEIGVGWDGHLEVLKKHNDGNDKPVVIFTSGTVVGGDPKGLRPSDQSYRLTDLKVGDVVHTETAITVTGEQLCRSVIIRRRPGGKIPPLPADQWGNPAHLSAGYQAEQDWEEKGIPIPAKFLNAEGRAPWTNPPYPPEAPAPRPAFAKP